PNKMPLKMSAVKLLAQQLEEIASDEKLKRDLEILPKNYNFEIPKTIWKIRSTNAKLVALQFPEGLLLYACVISDILEKHTGCDTVIMGDVTYGACCVDDYTATAMGCELLVHYGHSCLVPIQNTDDISMLYVFVSIEINLSHFIDCLKANFKPGQKIALVSTIQFIPSLQKARSVLLDEDPGWQLQLPQSKPLSPGEVLGCTSARLPEDTAAIIYLGDGRFHLESAMLHNPEIDAYQYDPYSRKLTREELDFEAVKRTRAEAIQKVREDRGTIGLIQGTLGRQGNIKIVQSLESRLRSVSRPLVRILLSEIFPEKLALLHQIDAYAQVACPRLSIDWGHFFARPLLSPYELSVALGDIAAPASFYPMDFYSNEVPGPWGNNHESLRPVREKRRPRIVVKTEG
ncbi:hypothetical protein PMAYCL1PPCAC_11384, partial [Pristionchus mayeri]